VEELKKFVGKDFTCFFAKIFFIRFFTPEYFDTAFFVWDIRKKRSKKLHLGFFICKFATLKSFTKSIQFQVREGLDFAECRYIDHWYLQVTKNVYLCACALASIGPHASFFSVGLYVYLLTGEWHMLSIG
jgi:hypothetical protein